MYSTDIEAIVRSFGYILNPNSRARDGASACTFGESPFDPSIEVEKWLNGPEDTKPDNSRSQALLVAYATIFGEGIRPEGLPTSDGRWFRPDRSVVRAFIRSEDMRLSNTDQPLLCLTEKAYSRIGAALTEFREGI